MAALLLTLTACTSAPENPAVPAASGNATAPSAIDAGSTDDCAGVTVIVDTGDLDVADDPSTIACIDTDTAISGTDAFVAAGITTVGSADYPDDVVCRVNDTPSATTELPIADGSTYRESCNAMPPPTAYWSLWTKTVDSPWDYAPSSLPSLRLNPGDSVQLLFTLNGAPTAPAQ